VSHPSLKNINELPPSIQTAISGFANKLLENLDDNLISVLVYGSAAGHVTGGAAGQYDHGVSNINIAVIVRNLDFAVLKQNLDLIKWGRKYKIATPLFLTKGHILNSLDVFPIEFSEIKEQHKVIWGEDFFKDLEIPRKDIRLLCEQQIKGKVIRLGQSYLDVAPHVSVIKNILISALNDLMPVFRQLIILKGQKPDGQKEEMLAQLAQLFSLDAGPLTAVYLDKKKKKVIPPGQVEAHLQNFISQLENLSRHLDSL